MFDWEAIASLDQYHDPTSFNPSQLSNNRTYTSIEINKIEPGKPYGHVLGPKQEGSIQILKDFKVDIWLWTETNVNWSKTAIKKAEQT
eukprot:8712981-Ditylum_brightwellii.AAC.1